MVRFSTGPGISGMPRGGRLCPLPKQTDTAVTRAALADHLHRAKAQHDADLAAGRGSVALPGSLRASTPTRRSNERGNGCFPRRVSTSTESPASGADITCTSLSSSAPLRTPRAPQGFRAQPRHTHFDIRSRPIFLKPAMTSAQSKNCSDTAASAHDDLHARAQSGRPGRPESLDQLVSGSGVR
jgi:hypothetical protein